MKKRLLLLMAVLVLAGCATNVRYVRYTSQDFPPKNKYYFITVYPQTPPVTHPYQVIGEVEVTGEASNGTTLDKITDRAKVIARQKGADAIINAAAQSAPYSGVDVIPGHTTYYPAVVAGVHRHGRHRHQEVATVYVPRYHRTQYIPYEDVLLSFRGELIVFNNDPAAAAASTTSQFSPP